MGLLNVEASYSAGTVIMGKGVILNPSASLRTVSAQRSEESREYSLGLLCHHTLDHSLPSG